MKTQIKTKTWDTARKTARRILPVMALAAFGAVAVPDGLASAESVVTWGPERPTFTWDNPATYPTMNSITDNKNIGDERNFVRIRKLGTEDKYGDEVTAEVGAHYEVYVYFHNNASTDFNADGTGIANNLRLSMSAPQAASSGELAEIKGTLSATNTNPGEVWDTAYIRAPENQTVYLRYVQNSAIIHSDGKLNGEKVDNDGLFADTGVKLGYDYWGVLPGCSEYAGYLTFEIAIDQPGFYMEKTASLEGKNDYGERITVSPGDTIDFKIRYKNIGTTLQTNVTVFDGLPDGMHLISGSTFLQTPTASGFEKDSMFGGGLMIGDYLGDQEAIVTYQAKIADDKNLFPCGETVIYNNSAVVTNNGTIRDKVMVTVKRVCEIENLAELPTAGPGMIVLGMIIMTILGIGITYYVMACKELRALRKVEVPEISE